MQSRYETAKFMLSFSTEGMSLEKVISGKNEM
jgi:hypothetical protein